MVLSDIPESLPPPAPRPVAEYRSDPAAIRGLFLAVGICTLAAIGLSLVQNGTLSNLGFSEPNRNPFAQAAMAGWIADVWHLMTPLAFLTIATAVWHLVQGSPSTRLVIKGLLIAWVIWIITGVMSVTLAPADSFPRSFTTQPGPNRILATGQVDESAQVGWLLKFALTGMSFFMLLGLISRRPDPDDDPSLRLPGVTEVTELDSASAPGKRQRSPTLGVGAEPELGLDWAGFRSGGFTLFCGLLAIPFFLKVISEDLLDVAAVLIGLLTLPVWLLVGELWEALEPLQLTIYFSWVLLSWLMIGLYVAHPRGLRGGLLFFNLGLAILFTWAGMYGQLNERIASQTFGLFLHALAIALAQGALLAVPWARDDRVAPLQSPPVIVHAPIPPSPLEASYAAFCPNCGQQVHARNGLCLYCGGGVHAL